MNNGIVIVGHGPSLIQRKLGAEIDEFLCVVKVNPGLKIKGDRVGIEDPPNWGTRCDVVCYPIVYLDRLDRIEHHKECWVIPSKSNKDDGEWWDEYRNLENAVGTNVKLRHAFTAIQYWKLRTAEVKGSKYGETSKPSSGLMCMIMALEFYRPRELYLAGFDNMKLGYYSKPNTMGQNTPHYPDVEKEMSKRISTYYRTELIHI